MYKFIFTYGIFTYYSLLNGKNEKEGEKMKNEIFGSKDFVA